MADYNPKEIEPKWQKRWADAGEYLAGKDLSKPKYYCLIEFPYPSGDGLHVGHIRSNTAMDLIARKRRAEGFDVLYPIGWDAFGLPTENYAIKTGKKPALVTKENTDNFRRQLQALGFSFDWSREVNTTDPAYYRWTQWIFLQFLKKGLAYKAKMEINWCPKDKIGLANEEVVDGCCERCGTIVEKREKEQWMLAITKYAERLERDLDDVAYLDKIKAQQRNWIGKSEGAEISFLLNFKKDPKANDNRGPNGERAALTIFTTRPDTIYGATYMVLAPEHPWVTLAADDNHDVLENKKEIRDYVAKAKKQTDIERTSLDREKTGVEIKGVMAINPATGAEIPIWVADYVLAHYGTGAVMAVPAHDERDMQFAKKYILPVKQVVEPVLVQTSNSSAFRPDQPYVDHRGVIAIVKHWAEDKFLALGWKNAPDWGTLLTGSLDDGLSPEETVLKEIKEETGYINARIAKSLGVIHGKYFHVPKNANRFGHADAFFVELVDNERLPLAEEEEQKHVLKWLSLAELTHFLTPLSHLTAVSLFEGNAHVDPGILVNSGDFSGQMSDDSKKKITESVGGKWVTKYKLRDWVFSRQRYWGEPIPVVHCVKCGVVPVPEKDLPVVLPDVEQYQPTDNGESPLALIDSWVNTICPSCDGPAKRETDTMPQWAGSSWYFLRYADPHSDQAFAGAEALKRWIPVDWYNGGMEHTTLHLLYSRFWHKFLFDIGVVPTSEPYTKRTSHGLILAEGGVKMSKSKGNVVNPDGIVDVFGADALRLYEMFMGPFDQAIAWNTDGLVGTRRFLERVWKLASKVSIDAVPSDELTVLFNQTIEKVSADIESLKCNTAVSALMIFANELEKGEQVPASLYGGLLQLLNPFVPHITEELWEQMGEKTQLSQMSWPKADMSKLETSTVTLVVQINGKVRDSVTVSRSASESEVKELVLSRDIVVKWLAGSAPKKVVYVPLKLVSIVV